MPRPRPTTQIPIIMRTSTILLFLSATLTSVHAHQAQCAQCLKKISPYSLIIMEPDEKTTFCGYRDEASKGEGFCIYLEPYEGISKLDEQQGTLSGCPKNRTMGECPKK
ncbi:hypothetical protein FB45DRAFT_37475 [Roridomyces roridus]|uniref:Uncharacterized protein n=1 Tax=Roridomyces roridus TaxID=1738132 RepID=A0AAD7BR41_9AGAR|nr:hypothetical protein FB45DRAFT_37475 [Roridomyces roridus]